MASKRLTHASMQTTEAFYDHLTVEDLRPEVEAFRTTRENVRTAIRNNPARAGTT
jgi:hypothetical protein